MSPTKKKAGRPRIFKTTVALQKAVDNFFKNPPKKRKMFSKDGELYEEIPVYTVCGLAISLGFESRQSIYDYINRNDAFSYIIKKAVLFVENEYEAALRENNVAGCIFALKNMGWRDKQELDIGGQEDNPVHVNVSNLTDAELNEFIKGKLQ